MSRSVTSTTRSAIPTTPITAHRPPRTRMISGPSATSTSPRRTKEGRPVTQTDELEHTLQDTDEHVDAETPETRPASTRGVQGALNVDDLPLRPSLEAVLMIADQPLDHVSLAQAVGAPPAEVERALQEL